MPGMSQRQIWWPVPAIVLSGATLVTVLQSGQKLGRLSGNFVIVPAGSHPRPGEPPLRSYSSNLQRHNATLVHTMQHT